jgi:transcriptional regulator with XRE-family HTH domain
VIISLPPVVTEQCAVGRRVRDVRQARGFSVERLATDAHVPPLRLRLAEQGRTRLSSAELHGVIMSLHISLDLLFEPDIDITRLRRL